MEDKTETARNYVASFMPAQYENYIRTELAGDFAYHLSTRINNSKRAAAMDAINKLMHDFRYEYEGLRNTDDIENWVEDWQEKNI